jgi:hypothetical protein
MALMACVPMAVVDVIHVVPVLDRLVATPLAMHVRVIGRLM